MSDPVQLPVILQPGQNARNAAPPVQPASLQGAGAPFALSLASLLQGASGAYPPQELSAGDGTDLPPADQNLPLLEQPEPAPLSEWPQQALAKQALAKQGDGEASLPASLPIGDRRADAVLLQGGQLMDRPLASQQVLEASQRSLSTAIETTASGSTVSQAVASQSAATNSTATDLLSGSDTKSSLTVVSQETSQPAGPQAVGPPAQIEGQAANDTGARPEATAPVWSDRLAFVGTTGTVRFRARYPVKAVGVRPWSVQYVNG
jgi:hypothetical protein